MSMSWVEKEFSVTSHKKKTEDTNKESFYHIAISTSYILHKLEFFPHALTGGCLKHLTILLSSSNRLERGNENWQMESARELSKKERWANRFWEMWTKNRFFDFVADFVWFLLPVDLGLSGERMEEYVWVKWCASKWKSSGQWRHCGIWYSDAGQKRTGLSAHKNRLWCTDLFDEQKLACSHICKNIRSPFWLSKSRLDLSEKGREDKRVHGLWECRLWW